MAYTLLARTLACVLITAATLKLAGLAFDPAPRYGWLALPGMPIVVLVWEIALAAWLLAGYRKVGAWLATLGTFSVFALASYQSWAIGRPSCGCFGQIQVGPWYVLAFDLGVLLLLVLIRPDLTAVRKVLGLQRPWLVRAGVITAVAVGSWLLLFGVLALLGFGSLSAAVAYLKGEYFSLSPSPLSIPRGFPGDIRETTVEVTNRTGKPVRLIGGTSDCSCITTRDMPLTLGAGESKALKIVVRLPHLTGRSTRTVSLWTDTEDIPSVPVRVLMDVQ